MSEITEPKGEIQVSNIDTAKALGLRKSRVLAKYKPKMSVYKNVLGHNYSLKKKQVRIFSFHGDKFDKFL